jgi:hypothetical protein
VGLQGFQLEHRLFHAHLEQDAENVLRVRLSNIQRKARRALLQSRPSTGVCRRGLPRILLRLNGVVVSMCRPEDPPFIKEAEVLWNPFDDIEPRTTRAERLAAAER